MAYRSGLFNKSDQASEKKLIASIIKKNQYRCQKQSAQKDRQAAKKVKKSSVSSNHNNTGITSAGKAESGSNDDGSGIKSDENSTTLSDNAKQDQDANEPITELKYPVGGHVYVEYRQIFYSSTILKQSNLCQ